MNIAVILSAGSGLRFNSAAPKQFLLLNNKPIISHSVQKFQECKDIDKILIVSHPEHIKKTKDICEAFSKVSAVIEGGKRRQDSVLNGLKWIKEHEVLCKVVFIHDSARPLFSKELIGSLYNAVLKHGAVIPAIATDDTIKEKEASTVVKTLDREKLVRVQTPQVFDFDEIYKAYLGFPKDKIATDDAFIVEFFGIKVNIVEGEKNNIKVTHPVDLKIAELLIKEVV